MISTKKMFNPQIEAEKLLLSTLIQRPTELAKIPSCSAEHFTLPTYKDIFKVIQKVNLTNNNFDLITVTQELIKQGKFDCLEVVTTDLMNNNLLTFSIEKTFSELQKTHLKRKSKNLVEKLLLDIDYSDQNISTLLTDFHYKTQSLHDQNSKFSPLEISLDLEFEQAAEVLFFQNELILRKGNIGLIQAAEGSGKSRAVTALISSSYANDDIDNLGFKLLNNDNELILHIDTEQEKTEVLSSMKRIIRRSDDSKIIENNKIKNYILQSFVTIPTIAEKKNWLFNLIEKYNSKIGVLILDGITDFINDINDLSESQDFVSRLISYMNVYDFAIVGTIHTNTGSDGSGKARGHIGSELKRKCGSNIAIVKTKLTHEFSERYGQEKVKRIVCLKNRFSTDDISSHYAWNAQKRMFSSCELDMDISQKRKISHSSKIELIIKEVVKNKEQLTHSDLCERLMEYTEKSKRTAKRNIETALKNGILTKGDNELYFLSSPELF